MSDLTTSTAVDAMMAAGSQPQIRTAIGAADMPRLRNRQALRDLTKAMCAFKDAPTSSRLPLAFIGDSIAELVPGEVIKDIGQGLPRASIPGPSVLQSTLVRTLSGATYDGDAVTVNQDVLDGTGGFADFRYISSARHITLGNGGILTWDVGNGGSMGISRIVTLFAAGPGMGSAFVEVYDRDTMAVLGSSTVNLSAGSLGGAKAEFTGLTNMKTRRLGLRVTATGSVVHLLTDFQSDYGWVAVHLSRGGCTSTQNCYASPVIMAYVAQQMGIALVMCTAKEEGGQPQIAAMMAYLAQVFTSASKLIIGSSPDVSGDAVVIAKNAIWENEALTAGFAYFDGFACFGSYAEVVRLGWEGLGTHLLEPANMHVSGLICAELPITRFRGFVIRENVDHVGSTSSRVASYAFQFFRGDESRTPVTWAEAMGGGSPAFMRLKNVERAWFGDPSGTCSGVGGYGPNEAGAFFPNGSFCPFNSLTLRARGTTGSSNFDSTQQSTSVASGAIIVAGGVGVGANLTLDGDASKSLRIVNPVANGSVATTLGLVGPTGANAGNPLGWFRINVAGTDRYIPFW